MKNRLMQVLAGTLRLLALALALVPAGAPAQAGNPRLANLAIELWPEYDRAGAVLVILKAELAPEVKLPAQVQLRLPVSSGGPAAVAFSSAADGNLLNLKHERSAAGDAVIVKFELPERFLHVEFYDPVATVLPARSYKYTWPGNFAAGRVSVVVQEPATSSNLEVEPKLDLISAGRDGLRYHAAELGSRADGKPLAVSVRYTKLELRPSAEIMKPKAGEAKAAAAPPAPAAPATAPAGAPFPASVLVLLAVALLAIGGLLMFLWWRGRVPRTQALPQGACTQCGTPRRPGDRFCAKCGAKLG